MDKQLGRLFDHIRDNESLKNNTIVLVCSDNGPDVDAGSAGPFRGTKATLYEGGTRSPLIVWCPGLMNATRIGRHNESSVFSAMDLVPSLLAVAKVPSPNEVRFDGENLSAVLLGQSDESRKSPLFWRRPPDRKMAYSAGPLPDLSVRDGQWKLLCEYDGNKAELYDLMKDAGEKQNLAAAQPEVVDRLTKAVIAWHHSMPPDNGAVLGTEPEPSPQNRKKKK